MARISYLIYAALMPPDHWVVLIASAHRLMVRLKRGSEGCSFGATA